MDKRRGAIRHELLKKREEGKGKDCLVKKRGIITSQKKGVLTGSRLDGMAIDPRRIRKRCEKCEQKSGKKKKRRQKKGTEPKKTDVAGAKGEKKRPTTPETRKAGERTCWGGSLYENGVYAQRGARPGGRQRHIEKRDIEDRFLADGKREVVIGNLSTKKRI